jgi:DNA-directed RNA polymerase specialized sigma24 family protein
MDIIMKTLDYEYLGELLRMAQAGNRNAFAELYMATCSRQYEYACRYLASEDMAKEALRRIYTRALREIHSLQTPQLFMAWLNRIGFQVCFEMQREQSPSGEQDAAVRIGGRLYSLNQVMNLPLTESQVLIQHYYQKLADRESGRNLDISRAEVKRYLRTGRSHLRKLLQVEPGKGSPDGT